MVLSAVAQFSSSSLAAASSSFADAAGLRVGGTFKVFVGAGNGILTPSWKI